MVQLFTLHGILNNLLRLTYVMKLPFLIDNHRRNVLDIIKYYFMS